MNSVGEGGRCRGDGKKLQLSMAIWDMISISSGYFRSLASVRTAEAIPASSSKPSTRPAPCPPNSPTTSGSVSMSSLSESVGVVGLSKLDLRVAVTKLALELELDRRDCNSEEAIVGGKGILNVGLGKQTRIHRLRLRVS